MSNRFGTCLQGKSGEFNGGFTYYISGLDFVNSPNKMYYQWESEAVFWDLDGSMTGVTGGKAVPSTPTLPPSCTSDAATSMNDLVPGSVCPENVAFHR